MNPFLRENAKPVVVGSVGGLSPAGRSGRHWGHGFIVRDSLEEKTRQAVIVHQARLMNRIRFRDGNWTDEKGDVLTAAEIASRFERRLEGLCFIRKPESPSYFNPYAFENHRRITLETGEVLWPRKKLPSPLPEGWSVVGEDPELRLVRIHITRETVAYIPQQDALEVSCGGMIPEGVGLTSAGFGTKGEKIPRNVKLALFGANDAMKSLGIPFAEIRGCLSPDQIGLYIGSAMGQLDQAGLAGYIQGTVLDRKVASTALPFSLNNMAADFVAAYVLGSLGHITCDVAACATFLYNLNHAVRDIRTGKVRFALVGCADAPIEPWVFAAYNAMTALGRDEALRNAGRVRNGELIRSAVSIPFGENFGFTLAEGSQFVTLFDPDFAIELGVVPEGGIGEVFCHSDGWKSSISKPGIGNYLSFGKAMASAVRDLGLERFQSRSFVSAHGSSTPQNRQTESAMLDQFAGVFGIQDWPVTAVKSWLGHTLGAASGDQTVLALGGFHHRRVSKIRNLERIPADVSRKHLHFLQEHLTFDQRELECCLINSKGFGGHNATAVLYSPQIVTTYLEDKLGRDKHAAYQERCQQTKRNQEEFERDFLHGAEMIDYCATTPLEEKDILSLDREGLEIRGFPRVRF